MATRLFISDDDGLELSRDLTDEERQHIESIKDGWGFQAFFVENEIYFLYVETEGSDPGEDGVEKPLKELLQYLKEEGITARGEIFLSSDDRDYYYDNMAITVKEDYTIKHEDMTLRNMDDRALIEELKRRGYTEPEKIEDLSEEEYEERDI